MCLLDGDGCIFSKEFLNDGDAGGKRAAASLKQAVAGAVPDGPVGSLLTLVYMNQAGLQNHLANTGVCPSAKFTEFVTGFNRSTELFSIVDVGRGKEAADAKIRGTF